tara:strand:- start:12197 stop:13447 length:1251 start_codon:yes stop_codon:yes gene_type:complete
MAGLLDKAKANTDTETKVVETPKNKSGGLLSKGSTAQVVTTTTVTTTETLVDGSNDTARIIGMAGWAIILVGAILSLQGGGFGLLVVLVVLAIGIGSIVQSQRMTGNVSQTKMIISIAVAAVIAIGPYAAVMIVPSNASMAVTELTINENDDQISFLVRGSFSEANAEIFAAGVSVWTGEKELDNDVARFKVPISSIFDGNALDYRAQQIKEYSITVTSSDGQEKSIPIENDMMTREVLNSAARISEVLESCATCNSGNSGTYTDGITVEAIVGLFSPSEEAQSDGEHSVSNLALIPVSSDYTFQLKVKKGSSVKYTMNTISVDGLDATWSSSMSGSQSGKTSGWLGMPGTATNQLNTEYLQRDDFYDGEGCYTFEITVTNTFVPEGGSTTVVSSDSWNLDWHESDSQKNGEMTTC